MIPTYTAEERRARLLGGGLGETDTDAWLAALEGLGLAPEPDPARLDSDAAQAKPVIERARAFCEALPLKSKRSPEERAAGETLIHLLAALCVRFFRIHREAMYRRLTGDYDRFVRVDDLLWEAAELWPGLLPARSEVAREQERMQMDKDGLEIHQGIFLTHLMTERRAGNHLLQAMLRPKAESLELLPQLRKNGAIDLGRARVEVRGRTGYVTFSNPEYLNAEDETVMTAQETATDLVLLHPGLEMGVLRGEPVDHPRYKGRRIFDAGINLTKIYHGKLGYLSFYMVRDLGFVNKLYRGLALNGWEPGEPENTQEKPWIAVVDTFAIGGGCQLLLVVDYVIAESGAYFSLPARKEGIIPGAANLRLPRFMGERMARQAIMFDRTFYVDSPEGATLVNEVAPRERLDEAVEAAVENALGAGMVSAGGNRKALRVHQEPLDVYREYLATYCQEQAFCHLSDQLIGNLERNWNAKERRLR